MGTASEPIELLRRLGEEYRHVKQEHRRQPLRGATRRRLERRLRGIQGHFERLLAEWASEPSLQRRWREFLHGRASAPDEPRLPAPPLFRGHTEAGAVIELRPSATGYEILVDGARVDRDEIPWHLEPDMRGRVQIGEHACEESFDASPDARRALGELLAGRAPPPWRWARELIEDGLIDAELALTPRGRRCLDRARPVAAPPPGAHDACVLVADAARARVLVLARGGEAARGGGPISELVELAEITNPARRARDVEALSESRPGLRREGPASPRHAVSDHREDRRRESERQFAARVAAEAAGVWRGYPACALILVASPRMLGFLRPAIERQLRAKDRIELRELTRDLTKISPAMLQDQLAEAGLLPARGRRAPLIATPGQPVP